VSQQDKSKICLCSPLKLQICTVHWILLEWSNQEQNTHLVHMGGMTNTPTILVRKPDA
jgi:hypothetical protein